MLYEVCQAVDKSYLNSYNTMTLYYVHDELMMLWRLVYILTTAIYNHDLRVR